MPQVSVSINGRQFRIACENGEELRLTRLAEDLDARIAKLRTRFGDIGGNPSQSWRHLDWPMSCRR
jgi:cell division protein ZapA